MRIGVDVTCWNNRRGYGRFTRGVLEALLELDRANEYIFFADPQTIAEATFPARAKVVSVATRVAPAEAASASGRRSMADLGTMSRAVSAYPLDTFFFPSVYTYFPVFSRARQVLTIHDVIPEKFPAQVFPDRKLRLFWQMKMALAKAQAHLVLTVSEHSKRGIIEKLHVPERKIRVVSEAADSRFKRLDLNQLSNPVLERYGLGGGAPYLLYVGGISPHKNLDCLLEAFASLNWHGRLLLVGDYRGDVFYSAYQPLKALVARLGLAERVLFTGFVPDEDLVYFYNAARAVVLPSLDEGFGLPALEAMACGTPVVASRGSSVPEIVGKAGLYFDPRQPAELTAQLASLLHEPDLAEQCQAQGLARAQEFSWERAASELQAVLSEAARLRQEAKRKLDERSA